MAKYIERGRLLSRINKLQEMCNAEVSGSKTLNIYNDIYNEIYTEVSNIETNDLRPERHGVWVRVSDDDQDEGRFICSECKEEYFNPSDDDDMLPNFCPDCGAKMDGKEKNDLRIHTSFER